VPGAADLAEANFGPLLNASQVADPDRGAIGRLDERVGDVLRGAEQADGLYVDLLASFFNEAAAAVGVVIG